MPARSDQGSELSIKRGASLLIAGGRGNKAHTQELSGGPCIGTGISNGGLTPLYRGFAPRERRVVQADTGSVARLILALSPIETESRRVKRPFSPDASYLRRGRRCRRHCFHPKSVVALGQWSRRLCRTAVPWGWPSACRYRRLGFRQRHHSSQNLS